MDSQAGKGRSHPCWGLLYKLPRKKRAADLQLRILHGAFSNAFSNTANPALSNQCLFCCLCVILLHIKSDCERLTVFFKFLASIFKCFNEAFSMKTFFYGARYNKAGQSKWQLQNVISSLYMSKKNKYR